MSNMEQIEVIVAEAMKCGMSYGEFVAKNPLYVARLSQIVAIKKKREMRCRNATHASINILIKTVIPLAKTNCILSLASGAIGVRSIKIREYKLPALMQLLYSNGRKPV